MPFPPAVDFHASAGMNPHGSVPLRRALKESNTAIIVDTLHTEDLLLSELGATTMNLRIILNALSEESVFFHIWVAARQTVDERTRRGIPNSFLIKASLERFLVGLGDSVTNSVTAPHLNHFTFVDPRRHGSTPSIIRNALRLVDMFGEKDFDKRRLVVSIPATDEGMKAAKELESKHGIHTNLYPVCSLLHAAACAEAGATAITIPVGHILESYEHKRKMVYNDLSTHPGIETLQSILIYFKLHNIKTKVIGSDFRGTLEMALLTELDCVRLPTDQIKELRGKRIPKPVPQPSATANLLARQAPYPTSFLSSESGFMGAVKSTETQYLVESVFGASLYRIKNQMQNIEDIVAKEVLRQYKLATLDLKTLCELEDVETQTGCEDAGPEQPRSMRAALHLDNDMSWLW